MNVPSDNLVHRSNVNTNNSNSLNFSTCNSNTNNGQSDSYVPIGSSIRGTRSQFEEARLSQSSVLVSNFPHVLGGVLPSIGPDSFPQWFSPMYAFVMYVLLFTSEGIIYSLFISTAFVTFPGTDPLSLFLKACIASGTVTFIYMAFSKWTGGYCDPFITMMVGFIEIFFNDKWKDYRAYGIMQKGLAVFKILIACFFNWVGFLIGFALMVKTQGGAVITSDCFADFTYICLAKPEPSFVGDSESKWQAVLGSLIIPGALMIAYGLNKKREVWTMALMHTGIEYTAADQYSGGVSKADLKKQKKANQMYVPYEINDSYIGIAVMIGFAHFIAVALYSRNLGYGFNFWYWFVTSIFTGDYSHASTYAWPMFLSCCIVFVAHTIGYLLSERSINYKRNKFQELNNEELNDTL